MQIANKKDVELEIANYYKLAFPCIKQTLNSNTTRADIIAVQQRLLTYKEVLLHAEMLDDKELNLAFSALNLNEKSVAKGGILSINKAIKEMDEIIERYSRKTNVVFT
ncbi:conserved hypothetical protein [Vibrio chagasii]|uniref:hypothetical protein n=1 Tax=Vibrio chagasii TaxID=170679 RepID=UPI001EFE2B92|nr:hypothetical protein [Vibrio chagasii]MDE9381845.1 hypothetical protein [Vibrio alginolyticus]MCG9606219.1 hypothetical protein [Vibrio chagasii]CAH7059696.1 conserved hypothetical protein [Vibrio chagasii]CAH7105099.1 conserved hypothetical protein [Vibrio chagasii]CAH7218580.1 conserved hypothetical protein [Vibrio chagasii]